MHENICVTRIFNLESVPGAGLLLHMKISNGLLVGIVYFVLRGAANAQIIDPSLDILNNQVDQNVIQNVETVSGNTVEYNKATTPEEEAAGVKNGYTGSMSGLQTQPTNTVTLALGPSLFQETFNEQNSFIGKGVTDGYTTQLGQDFKSKYGTDIQAFFTYQHSGRDLSGTTTYRADSYGGTISVQQKILPFVPLMPGQTSAVYNFDRHQVFNTPGKKPIEWVEDVYPNWDAFAGLTAAVNSVDMTNLKKHTWLSSTQDNYTLSPNLTFDFYLRRPAEGDTLNPIPNTITVLSTYTDQMSEDAGASGSAGVLSIQDRNSYYWVLGSGPHDRDLGTFPTEALILTQTNAVVRDTNQESITPPTGFTPYQTWGRFGVALTYQVSPTDKTAIPYTIKAEYTYEAFNELYETHNVVLSCNIKF